MRHVDLYRMKYYTSHVKLAEKKYTKKVCLDVYYAMNPIITFKSVIRLSLYGEYGES